MLFIRTLTKAVAVISLGCHAAPSVPPDAGTGGVADAEKAVDAMEVPPQSTRLRFVNRCADPIRIAPLGVDIPPGGFHDADIPDEGLPSVRYWVDLGPGLPPIDSKFEATFAPINSTEPTWYNLSLVDGYTLPIEVVPVGDGAGQGSCVASDCTALTLDACPSSENLGDGTIVDLRVEGIGCLSPCKAWNYPAPFGLGQPESINPGLHMCCPAPFSPEDCRDAGNPLSVVHTDFVALVHERCPTAYAYSYDDAAGLHQCPARTGFEVSFCR